MQNLTQTKDCPTCGATMELIITAKRQTVSVTKRQSVGGVNIKKETIGESRMWLCHASFDHTIKEQD